MANLKTEYLGLKLDNPIIVSSSGLTDSSAKVKKLAEAGAGAVVLKSLFEEQINHDINRHIVESQDNNFYPEANDMIANYTRENTVGEYLKLIEDCKSVCNIPIIASVNCFSTHHWLDFAKRIEAAGADAIELNINVINTDLECTAKSVEDIYFEIIKNVTSLVNIPVSAKIGNNFINLTSFVDRLRIHNAKGVVLFNRFYQPDIDINKLSIGSASVFSTESDIRNSLRWVGIISDKVKGIDISASTGNHNSEAVIKQLLAGASTVQVCSGLYKNGIKTIGEMLNELSFWMEEKGYNSIDDFRGILSYRNIENPLVYERSQFMRYFSQMS